MARPTAPKTARFGKDRRVRKSAEFTKILQKGARGSGSALGVAVVSATGPGRIGISVPVKVGGAVQRNRARRVIRERFRHMDSAVVAGYDIVVNLRPGFALLSGQEAGSALDEAISKAIAAGKRPRKHPHAGH